MKDQPPCPPCFTQAQWDDYLSACHLEAKRMNAKRPKVGSIDPCHDCTPEHQRAMCRVARCEHPETVFVRNAKQGVIGIARLPSQASGEWEQAIMGFSGSVVSKPSAEVIQRTIEASRSNA